MLSLTFLPLTSILCTYIPHISHERTEQDEQEVEKYCEGRGRGGRDAP